jgi:hypothetical protein
MRPSTHDDCITRGIADRVIARLAARRGLRWPPAAEATPAAARRQPDLFNDVVIKNIDPDEIEDLGRELIQWRLTDLIKGMRYAHGIVLHKTTVESLSGEVLDFLTETLGAPSAADEIRRRGLALARAAEQKGIVRGGAKNDNTI